MSSRARATARSFTEYEAVRSFCRRAARRCRPGRNRRTAAPISLELSCRSPPVLRPTQERPGGRRGVRRASSPRGDHGAARSSTAQPPQRGAPPGRPSRLARGRHGRRERSPGRGSTTPLGLTRTGECRQSGERGTNPVSAGRATRSAGAKSPRSPVIETTGSVRLEAWDALPGGRSLVPALESGFPVLASIGCPALALRVRRAPRETRPAADRS